VALESWSWRLVEPRARRVVLVAATRCRDAGGRDWGSVVAAALGPRGGRLVRERTVEQVTADPDRLSVELGPGALRAQEDRLTVDLDRTCGSTPPSPSPGAGPGASAASGSATPSPG
jgi:hypothetical protein